MKYQYQQTSRFYYLIDSEVPKYQDKKISFKLTGLSHTDKRMVLAMVDMDLSKLPGKTRKPLVLKLMGKEACSLTLHISVT